MIRVKNFLSPNIVWFQSYYASPGFQIVLPGSEIAKWFSDQTSMPAICIELPSNWRESYSKLKGWALCVCRGPSHDGQNLHIYLEINGVTKTGYFFDYVHTECINLSDSLWILYQHKEDFLDEDYCDPPTVVFVIRDDRGHIFRQHKRFGARLVYEETVQELAQIISNNCATEWE